MRTYKPLQIPNNSAWDRKTWRSYSPVWFLEFVRGIQNLIHWLPVIWKDRHWDDHYIFEVLKHKIKLQQKYIVNSNRHTRVNIDNRDMTIVLNLIERIQDDYYALECYEYENSKFRFEPAGDEKYTIERDVISENYDAYLKKYRTSVRAVMKKDMETTIDKSKLCFWVAQHNQQKAHDLLFRILKERLTWWWD